MLTSQCDHLVKNRPSRLHFVALGALVVASSLLASRAFAVSRVQTVTGANGSATTVSASWPDGTTIGNLLVAILGVRGGSGTTITPPSGKGWTLAARSDNSTNNSTAIYYSANAAAQSGSQTFTLSATVRATLTLIEYVGASPSTVLDRTATSSGSSTTAATGTTATTTQASEVSIAAISAAGAPTYSGLTNSFSEVSEIASSGTSGVSTMFGERMLTATGTSSASATLSGSATWTGAVATFKTAIRYWIGTSSSCATSTNYSLSSGGPNNTGAPDLASIVVFDGNKTTSCTLTSTGSIQQLQIASGYTGTITIDGASGGVLWADDVTMAGGNLSGAVTIAGTLSISGGTWDTNGRSMTVTGATQVTGGTFKVNTGTQTMTGGLTVGSSGTLDLSGANGKLLLGPGSTLAVNGTLIVSGSGNSVPRIDSVSGNYAFTVGSTGILNLNGLRIEHIDANGMNVTSATFSSFQNVQFRNNAGGTNSTHLRITKSALQLSAPACYFDGTATYAVKLVGNGDADGQTLANIEYRNTPTNGSHAGDGYQQDDDSSPRNGVGDHSTTDGAVVQWMYSVVSDTAGTVEGFPTAAFDWNTFTWYGVYVAYRDTAGASTADKIYVRSMDGDPMYSYSIAQTDGDIIGSPRWDSLSEVTLGQDVNGDGDSSDTAVHVLYVPTSAGKIYKLIDNGSTLAPPGASSLWATAFSDSRITGITSALISDGTNLYFGGKDNGSPSGPRVFGVQIAKGANEKTLVKNIGAASVITVAPAWKAYSGTTYLFIGSQALTGQAYVYRMDVSPGASINATATDAKHDVNGSVRLLLDHAVVGDSGGRLHHIAASVFTAGGFANTTGFPYRDTSTHTASFLDAGSGAIQNSPYVDPPTGYIYFGDKDGHLYALSLTGSLLAGFPIRLSTTDQLNSSPIYASGVIMIGSNGGKVYYVDQKNGSSAPALFQTLSFGSAGISSIAYNANKSMYMVATSTGQLFFINKLSDPTPSSN